MSKIILYYLLRNFIFIMILLFLHFFITFPEIFKIAFYK